jgi:hypothetical protein
METKDHSRPLEENAKDPEKEMGETTEETTREEEVHMSAEIDQEKDIDEEVVIEVSIDDVSGVRCSCNGCC